MKKIKLLAITMCMLILIGIISTVGFAEEIEKLDVKFGQLNIGDETCTVSLIGEKSYKFVNKDVKLFTTDSNSRCVANGTVKYSPEFDLYYIDFSLLDTQKVYHYKKYKIEFSDFTNDYLAENLIVNNYEIEMTAVSQYYIDKSTGDYENINIKIIGSNTSKIRSIELHNSYDQPIKRWDRNDFNKEEDISFGEYKGFNLMELNVSKEDMAIGDYKVIINDGKTNTVMEDIKINYKIEASRSNYNPGDQIGKLTLILNGVFVESDYQFTMYEKNINGIWGYNILENVTNPVIEYNT